MTRIEIKSFELTASGMEKTVASIPAGLHSTMIAEGLFENPFVGDNIRGYSRPDAACDFSARIEIDALTRSSKHIYLSLSGISANAEIFFNGKSYGFTSSVSRIYYFDITDGVVEGENELIVRCISRLPEYGLASGKDGAGYEIPPSLTDIGIFGECYIIATSSAFIEDVAVLQRHENGAVTLDISVSCLGDDAAVSAVATLVSPVGSIYYGGISGGSGSIYVPDPALWYPNGLGNQPLYRLSVTLYEGDAAVDTREIMIGIRSLSLADENGAPRLYVNGEPIFSLGATYITRCGFLPDGEDRDACREKIENFVLAAKAANMNTLRLVGYGYCPPRFFYELCDKHGIVVWQDISLPFTGALTADLITSYREQTKDLVADIAYHASVSLIYFSPIKKSTDPAADEGSLEEFYAGCSRFIAPIIDRYAGDLIFVKNEDYLKQSDEISAAGGLDYPSLPEYSSIRRFTRRKDRNALSPVIELHTREGDIARMLVGISKELRYAEGFDRLLYSSQLAHALAVGASVERARVEGKLSSAVFRELNDEWPSCNASFIDYYGRAKAVYYRAKHFFRPVSVAKRATGESMLLSVANDSSIELVTDFIFALYDDNDKCCVEKKLELRVPPHSVRDVTSEDFSQYISGEPWRYYVLYELTDTSGTNISGVAFFEPIKRFELKNPYIKYSVSGSGQDFEISLRSDALAVGVCIYTDLEDAVLSDNFIDMPEGSAACIRLRTKEVTDASSVERSISIISAYDIDK